MLCHPDTRKDLAQGQRIILQETLRDSSLTLRMTRYYERFAAPKLTKNLLFLFLHLEAQSLDGADNLFGGGGACHGDEAAGEVGIYVLGAG